MDWTQISVAVIAFLGTALGAYLANSKTIYRIELLEKKMDKHNGVIERTYELEKEYEILDEKLKVCNHRIEDLERR